MRSLSSIIKGERIRTQGIIDFSTRQVEWSTEENEVHKVKEDTNKDDWEKLLKLYKDGERDISCEHFEGCSPSFIEAVSEDEERILVRY